MGDPTMADVLARLGRQFAVFDERTQDSGHVSYGIEATDGRRLFVKTPGTPRRSTGGTTQPQRVSLLRHGARVHEDVSHSALIALRGVVDASDGVVVIYDWFDGELLRCPPDRRESPDEAHNRFKSLPAAEITAALGQVIALHAELERAGWVAGDFYDGCLMYDFSQRQIKVMDFECYRRGPYVNDEGRLPGSSRFMAPEEFQLGATIDSRTTVFNLGRMIDLFLLAHHALPDVQALVDEATAPDPEARPASVASVHQRWSEAVSRAL